MGPGQASALPRVGLRLFAERDLGLTLSPRMAAIMEASDGRDIRTVAVRAGARGGKSSRLAASKALHACWTVPLPTLASNEAGVFMLVAPDLKLARQTLSFVVGLALGSSTIGPHVVGDPTKDCLELRRQDGKVARVEVLAASARGRATRGRTLLGAALDEACFFRDEATGAVNDTEIYDSVLLRIVPGGQCWVVSTPWLAKTGLLESLMELEDPSVYAVTATTRELNPMWDPDGSIERVERARDPDKARREIDAVPINSSAVHFFDAELVDRCVDRTLRLPRVAQPGEHVGAGGDFGFRSDSSAAVVVHQAHDAIRVGDLLELQPAPGVPLVPSVAIRTIAERLRTHAGLTHLVADAHYQETVCEHLAESGLGYVPAPLDVGEVYVRARALMREGRVRLPDHPRLLAQLRSVQWRPNPGGSISIVLPRERTGGHCDLVSALVLALWQAASVEVSAPPPAVGSPEWSKAEEARIEAQFERRLRERQERQQELEDRW